MIASEHLGPQWHQLDMYQTAKALRKYTLLDVEDKKIKNKRNHRSNADVDNQVMDKKLATSKKSGLYDSVKRVGVQDPVSIGEGRFLPYKKNTVANGHHRIAAAYKINKNMLIPVEHIGLEPFKVNGKTYNS